jgi:hypothetical protein
VGDIGPLDVVCHHCQDGIYLPIVEMAVGPLQEDYPLADIHTQRP